jgi:hypothetical protein
MKDLAINSKIPIFLQTPHPGKSLLLVRKDKIGGRE